VKQKNNAKDESLEFQGELEAEDKTAKKEKAEKMDRIWELLSDLNPY